MSNRDDASTSGAVEAGCALIRAMISTADEGLLDDNELMAVAGYAIDGLAEHLRTLGATPEQVEAGTTEVWSAARDRYLAIWMRQAHEFEEGPVDDEGERREGLRAFELARRGER